MTVQMKIFKLTLRILGSDIHLNCSQEVSLISHENHLRHQHHCSEIMHLLGDEIP